MDVLDWAMMAAGLGLFLGAVNLLFRGERGEGDKRKSSLGCTFGLIASLVWAYSFQKLFGSWWSGFRLSVGIALLLPAIAAFAHPDRGRLIRAMIALVIGAMLAGPMIQPLLDRMQTTETGDTLTELESSLRDMRISISKLQALQVTLDKDKQQLNADIRALELWDFEALVETPGALQKLREFAEIRRMKKEAAASIVALEERIPRVESAIRRLERHALASESMGEELDESEIDALLEEFQREPVSGVVTPVKEHMERAELKSLFEEVFVW